MDIADWFNHLSPHLIMTLSFIVLLGVIMLYKKSKYDLLFNIAMIPLFFTLLYAWIGFVHPQIENSRTALRSVVIFSLTVSIHVLWCEIKRLYGRRIRE